MVTLEGRTWHQVQVSEKYSTMEVDVWRYRKGMAVEDKIES